MSKRPGARAVRTGKKPLKLTVVGGGSYFVPSFIGSMVKEPGIWAGAEICLNDPNSERVRLVKAFNEKYVLRQNFPMTFTAQPDPDRALAGADFVITTFRAGGVRALHMDENIPPRFGYLGDETAGPGGMFMAIRTVPVAVALAKRMEKLCPAAWLLNYSNPTHYVTSGVLKATRIKSVGLCDNYIAAKNDFAFLLGLADVKNIKVRFCGYNHCNWVYSATYRGRDLLKVLKQSTPAERKKHLVKAKSERGKWDSEKKIKEWLPIGEGYKNMWGAFDQGKLVGFSVYRRYLTDDMAQFAILHISKRYRRRGIGKQLSEKVIEKARMDGVRHIYLTSTPTKITVDFYIGLGFKLAKQVNKHLYEMEPEDIHMIMEL